MIAVETQTMLFSDIEGSTRLAAAAGDGYAAILGLHRSLIRHAVAEHHGVEQSTEGDSFFFLFRSARDGLAAAVDAQLALAAHPWEEGLGVRVRMGLHAGEISRADHDVVGLAIHEAARIMAAAHGGQVLISSVLRDLTAGAEPSGSTMLSLGLQRLKDFDRPVELFQVLHPDLDEDFPPPRTRPAVLDLPAQRTSFIGRDAAVARVTELLSGSRHVTLTGVGGSGKTRLAVEVARGDAHRHPDGVFFVDLAPLADGAWVASTVAECVGAQGDPSDLDAMLVTFLADRRALIVLDNCEHLIDACADVVDLVLGACPLVHVLATSRESLQIDGEQVFTVPSLDVDDDESEAVLLFVARAQAVVSGFELTEGNRTDVVGICRRLDGIPLAIELAAGRTDHLSVGDIASRLDDRFELLVGGRRRRAQRQQTLQAAMDWSWELLTDAEQTVLRRLAVFAGPFALDGAEAVCGHHPLVAELGSLVAKSLVAVEASAATAAYRLLETVRMYSLERLVEAGEAAQCRDAHRDWYLAFTEQIPFDDLLNPPMIAVLVADQGNLRAAMDWSATQRRTDLVARQLLPTSVAWSTSPALFEETRLALNALGDDEQVPGATRADALTALGMLAMNEGQLGVIAGFIERAAGLDDSDRPMLTWMRLLQGNYVDGIAVALRVGQPDFAFVCRAWVAAFSLPFDPQASLLAVEELEVELGGATGSRGATFAYLTSALVRLVLDDPEGALEASARLRVCLLPFGEARLGFSYADYADITDALALAHLGRFDDARAMLVPVTRGCLRDRYPLVGNDCLVALSYIAAREGDVSLAASLLDPVLRDGRARLAPMLSFTFWLLGYLHELAPDGMASALPDQAAAMARSRRILRGSGWMNDPDAAGEIESILVQFVG